jgi:nitrogen fixation protein FixH
MKQITGKHVLFILFAFFGVMLAVNGVFVYFATATFSGVSTEDAYRKGLHYNETIAAFQVQQATGWHSAVSLDGPALRLEMQDASGRPIDGLMIEGTLERPATNQEVRTLTFHGAGNGLYSADVANLANGQWQLQAEARAADASQIPPYKVTARIWQKP